MVRLTFVRQGHSVANAGSVTMGHAIIPLALAWRGGAQKYFGWVTRTLPRSILRPPARRRANNWTGTPPGMDPLTDLRKMDYSALGSAALGRRYTHGDSEEVLEQKHKTLRGWAATAANFSDANGGKGGLSRFP